MNNSSISVHSVPCAITVPEGSTDAQVDKYFDPLIRPCDTSSTSSLAGQQVSPQVYSTSFRGRPLKGVDVTFPEGYKGVVLTDANKTCPTVANSLTVIDTSSNTRSWHSVGEFSEFKYWTLDTPPALDDKVINAIKWIKTSQHIHLPVTPSDV